MRFIKKAFVILLSVILVLALVGAGTFVYLTRYSFPQISGNVTVPALRGEVTIVRDKFGVPHIYADTVEDLFKAQGFIHAQDRFFQMEFWRRIGQGRLSELLGKGTLEQDKFIRTIGWHRWAAQEAAALDGEAKTILESYAAGVNAYTQPNLNDPAKLGIEFRILGLIGRKINIEPWTPYNTLTWAKVMAWDLSGKLNVELTRMALLDKGGAAMADALLPSYPSDMPVIVPSRGAELGESVIAATQQQPNLTAQSALALLSQIESLDTLLSATDDKTSIGSNNWVVAGSRSATGKPILSNDPHLGIQMPSIWYQVGLHCRTVSAACPYDVVGVSFPGTPGVIVGHNQRIAWGVTNVGPDVHDLFIEKQNPSNANEFEFMGKYEPAQVIDEVINVAGEAPVSLKVRVTRHGPIMNDVSDLLKDQAPIAYRWTALENNKLFQSVLQIDKAQNWTDFRNALRSWDVPSQNFVYADVDGNIGYQTPGKIPMRAKGDGTVAVSGWSGEYEWTGYIPFEELPSSFNPPEGYIVTANNAVVDGKYKYNLGKDWDYGYRAREIVNRITAKEKFSVEDMRNIQFDSYSGTAQDLLPQLKSLQPNFGADATAQAAWQKMIAWDGKSVRDSVGATIFETFWNKLAHQIFDDDLGADLAKRVIGMGTANRTAVRNVIGNISAKWWDDITTQGKTETRDDIVVRAMQATATQLKDKLGADVNAWTWGKLHTATFKNQSLGSSGIAPIEQLLNRGPYAADGATAAVNAVSHGESMIVSSVPSLRIVMDVSDWRNSKMIHTTGQSGHTMNAHYDDMIDSWLNSKANPLLWARADIDANSEGTLHLLPQTN